MQLTRQELTDTQVIITTPEKWDVITRKSTDVALTQIVKLLIIDEVHLLNEGLFIFIPFPSSFILRHLHQTFDSTPTSASLFAVYPSDTY